MPLRGKAPEAKDTKLKFFMFGPAGVGKTLAAIQFPNAYIIDLEQGTNNYHKLINQKNSFVFQSTDPFDIENEIDCLINEQHNFKTLIIDPITILWTEIQEKWHEKFVKSAIENKKLDILEDFGMRFWQKCRPDYKRIIKKILKLNMNVIITAHQKDKYSGQNLIGVTSDSEKGDEHSFDFVFRLYKQGKEFYAQTIKQRILPIDKQFPDMFNWNYENLLLFTDANLVNGDFKNTTTTEDENKTSEEKEETPMDVLKMKMKETNILQKDFKPFLKEVIQWDTQLKDLDNDSIKLLLNNWDVKILPKFNEYIKNLTKTPEIEQQNNTNVNDQPEGENKEIPTVKEETEQLCDCITEEQKNIISNLLSDNNITDEKFLDSFNLKSFNDINFEAAKNIIKYIDNIITQLKE
jgi:hypothetical protein